MECIIWNLNLNSEHIIGIKLERKNVYPTCCHAKYLNYIRGELLLCLVPLLTARLQSTRHLPLRIRMFLKKLTKVTINLLQIIGPYINICWETTLH